MSTVIMSFSLLPYRLYFLPRCLACAREGVQDTMRKERLEITEILCVLEGMQVACRWSHNTLCFFLNNNKEMFRIRTVSSFYAGVHTEEWYSSARTSGHPSQMQVLGRRRRGFGRSARRGTPVRLQVVHVCTADKWHKTACTFALSLSTQHAHSQCHSTLSQVRTLRSCKDRSFSAQ